MIIPGDCVKSKGKFHKFGFCTRQKPSHQILDPQAGKVALSGPAVSCRSQ